MNLDDFKDLTLKDMMDLERILKKMKCFERKNNIFDANDMNLKEDD